MDPQVTHPPVTVTTGPPSAPRPWRRYPWETWMDGEVHAVQLTPGHNPGSFTALLHGKASKSGRYVRVRRGAPLPPGQVRFQFTARHWWDTDPQPEPDGWTVR